MFRKLTVIAVAIAMPVGIIAGAGGVAGANSSGPAAADSIVCTGVTGTITFSRPLNNTGYTSGTIVSTVKATQTGCKVSGSTKETVTKGTTTGTLTSAAGTKTKPIGTCDELASNSTEVGTMSTAWNASALSAYPSKIAVKSIMGGLNKTSHGTFTIPGKTANGGVTGSFGGAAKTGSKDKIEAETTLTAAALFAPCKTSGMKSLSFNTNPGVDPVSLNS
jgi:hypothetical protein